MDEEDKNVSNSSAEPQVFHPEKPAESSTEAPDDTATSDDTSPTMPAADSSSDASDDSTPTPVDMPSSSDHMAMDDKSDDDSDDSESSTMPSSPEPAEPAMPSTPPADPEPAMDDKPADDMPADKLMDDEPTASPSVTAAPGPVSGSGDKKFGMMQIIMFAVLVLAIAVAAYFAVANKNSSDKVANLEADVATLGATTHELPASAVKVSECVPNMGFHYLFENGNVQFGPFYLVNKAGEVIGLEYMFSNEMFTDIPNPELPLELILFDGSSSLSLNDWKFSNLEISHLPEGHPEFEEDHYDVHLYTVSPEMQAAACE